MDQLSSRFCSGAKMNIAVVALMCADAVALVAAVLSALLLRFDGLTLSAITHKYLLPHTLSLSLALAAYLAIYASFRLYRYAWRFASVETFWGVVYANTLGLMALIVIQVLIEPHTFPRSVLITIWLMSIALVGGMRILLRSLNLSRQYGHRAWNLLRKDAQTKRVVILGGGGDGARLLSALRDEVENAYDVLGFLDDQPERQGIYIRGVQVLGPLSSLYDLLAEKTVDEVLIALPQASGADIREYVMACRKQHVPVKVVPGLHDVLNGKARPRLEEISVEDLLRRPPVQINMTEIGGYLSGKRVLVTGAGGSIGSELCRQIIAMKPSKLILYGHGENSIHHIQQELLITHPEMTSRIHAMIGSIADDVRVEHIFEAHHPQVIFHAAAHKHVPMMEGNVPEAVHNNVMGTRCIAEAAGRFGIERMVLISTDKAVNPSSVMGATKWLCEETVRASAAFFPKTRFMTVRFGNVLGSRGSVVPIFRAQIKRGGPVTITHPDVTRFFMTIPEAVQLVLEAGAIGTSGDLYLLEMGKPVKILDLARDMIRLSGLEPDVDIPIVFTGMRPGEKLHEQLAVEDAIIKPASCKGLSIVHRQQYFSPQDFRGVLRRLQQLASAGETAALLSYLGEIVPSFADQRDTTVSLPASDTDEVAAWS